MFWDIFGAKFYFLTVEFNFWNKKATILHREGKGAGGLGKCQKVYVHFEWHLKRIAEKAAFQTEFMCKITKFLSKFFYSTWMI